MSSMPVVTMSEVITALRVTVGKRGMSEDDLRALADYLMSFFGFETEAIDNNLDAAGLCALYMLEAEGPPACPSPKPRPSPYTMTCPMTSGTVRLRRDRLKYTRRFVRSLAWWIWS